MNAEITPITKAEVPLLLELIIELATFERLEKEVESTVEILTESLFGARPAAGAFLARVDGKLAGYAIYFFTFSSFLGRAGIWLEDVYVRPDFRQRGLGSGLIKAVAKVGVERNCGRFEWVALDWNERALEIYRKMGARTMSEWVMLRMTAADIRRLASSADESAQPSAR
jgi:GNAT superfamily N-acetyltransferase